MGMVGAVLVGCKGGRGCILLWGGVGLSETGGFGGFDG